MRVIHLICAKTWGGGERYALDLCDMLNKSGYEVNIFSRGLPVIDSAFQSIGITVHKVPLKGVLDFVSPYKIAQFILSGSEDDYVIHVHNFKDAITAVRTRLIVRGRKRIRIVCTRHLVRKARVSSRWNKLYNNLDKIIFVSEFAKRKFLSSKPSILNSRIEVVNNSIIVPEKYTECTAPPSAENNSLNILYIGRISQEKGIETLIDSLKFLTKEDIIVKVCGTGDYEYISKLKERAQENGVSDKIEWGGFVNDVFPEIRKSQICVVPSKVEESFGLSIIEAMSQGRPVVTSNNGAQPEIIRDGVDGVLFSADSSKELSMALEKLIHNDTLREKMSEMAYTTFKSRFTYDLFFSKIVKIYANEP